MHKYNYLQMYQGGGLFQDIGGFFTSIFGSKTSGNANSQSDPAQDGIAQGMGSSQYSSAPDMSGSSPTTSKGGLLSGISPQQLSGGLNLAVSTYGAFDNASKLPDSSQRTEAGADAAVNGVGSALSALGPWGAVAGTTLKLVNGVGGSLMNHNSTAKAADNFKLNSDVMNSSSYGGITSNASLAQQDGQAYKKSGLFGKLLTNTGNLKNEFSTSNAQQAAAAGILNTSKQALQGAASSQDMFSNNLVNKDYNSQMWNNGSVTTGKQGLKFPMAKSGIHINPANKGKFTATKKKTGESTEELTHSKNPLTRKRAVFAENAKKWKHQQGGQVMQQDATKVVPPPRTTLTDNSTQQFLDYLSKKIPKTQVNAINSIRFENGNPSIEMSNSRSSYRPSTNTINVDTSGKTGSTLPDYDALSEIAHSIQWKNDPFADYVKSLKDDILYPNSVQYGGRGTVENQAHSIIEPKLGDLYNKRTNYNNAILNKLKIFPDMVSDAFKPITYSHGGVLKRQGGGSFTAPYIPPIGSTQPYSQGYGSAYSTGMQFNEGSPFMKWLNSGSESQDPQAAGVKAMSGYNFRGSQFLDNDAVDFFKGQRDAFDGLLKSQPQEQPIDVKALTKYAAPPSVPVAQSGGKMGMPNIRPTMASGVNSASPIGYMMQKQNLPMPKAPLADEKMTSAFNDASKEAPFGVPDSMPGVDAPNSPPVQQFSPDIVSMVNVALSTPVASAFQSGGSVATSGSNGTLTYEEMAKKLGSPIKHRKGGKLNVIVNGEFHAHKHELKDTPELEDAEITLKGVPVVTKEDGEITQHAEVEKNELILHIDLTRQLEALMKEGSEDAMVIAGKLLAKELVRNTRDSKDKVLANA